MPKYIPYFPNHTLVSLSLSLLVETKTTSISLRISCKILNRKFTLCKGLVKDYLASHRILSHLFCSLSVLLRKLLSSSLSMIYVNSVLRFCFTAILFNTVSNNTYYSTLV